MSAPSHELMACLLLCWYPGFIWSITTFSYLVVMFGLPLTWIFHAIWSVQVSSAWTIHSELSMSAQISAARFQPCVVQASAIASACSMPVWVRRQNPDPGFHKYSAGLLQLAVLRHSRWFDEPPAVSSERCRKSHHRSQVVRSQSSCQPYISCTGCKSADIKNAIIQQDKLSKVKLGENYPRPSATCNAVFKVIKSNTEIAITLRRIAQFRSNLVQSFIAWHAIYCKCLRLKVQGQGHSVN